MIKNIISSILDIKESYNLKHIWQNLAIMEIKSSYKRTKLGPFWIVITTFVLMSAMGPLYAYIFKVNFKDYFLYIICGFTFWEFIKQNITDFTKVFSDSHGFILSQPFPITLYILKSLYKNILILLHNVPLVVIVVVLLNKNINLVTFIFFIIGSFMNFTTLFFSGLIVSIFCTRFRDVAQIIMSILTVMFFLTPILWSVDMAGERAMFLYGNIFFVMIDVMRSPLVDSVIPYKSIIVLIFLNLILIPVSLFLFGKFKDKVPFWV